MSPHEVPSLIGAAVIDQNGSDALELTQRVFDGKQATVKTGKPKFFVEARDNDRDVGFNGWARRIADGSHETRR
jgi:hypothetical protein